MIGTRHLLRRCLFILLLITVSVALLTDRPSAQTMESALELVLAADISSDGPNIQGHSVETARDAITAHSKLIGRPGVSVIPVIPGMTPGLPG